MNLRSVEGAHVSFVFQRLPAPAPYLVDDPALLDELRKRVREHMPHGD